MGQAKRKKETIAKWRGSLNEQEATLVRVAERLANFLTGGACYRAALFLKYHLSHCYGVEGDAVIGFVNDGTDIVDASHAWYIYQNKMTDVSLWRPFDPTIQKNGPLIIHGNEIMPGWPYNYSIDRSPRAEAFIQESLLNTTYADFVKENENIHAQMLAISSNNDLIRSYLDSAPDGVGYKALASKIEL